MIAFLGLGIAMLIAFYCHRLGYMQGWEDGMIRMNERLAEKEKANE